MSLQNRTSQFFASILDYLLSLQWREKNGVGWSISSSVTSIVSTAICIFQVSVKKNKIPTLMFYSNKSM